MSDIGNAPAGQPRIRRRLRLLAVGLALLPSLALLLLLRARRQVAGEATLREGAERPARPQSPAHASARPAVAAPAAGAGRTVPRRIGGLVLACSHTGSGRRRSMGNKGFKQHSKVVWPGYTEVDERHVAKVGRNQPCPCGSGRKYKECHEKDGTSFLEKLAQTGIRFDRHTAQSSLTKSSMASLLSGLSPLRSGVTKFDHTLSSAIRMPAEILSAAGFKTVGALRNGWVEGYFGFDQGFEK